MKCFGFAFIIIIFCTISSISTVDYSFVKQEKVGFSSERLNRLGQLIETHVEQNK